MELEEQQREILLCAKILVSTEALSKVNIGQLIPFVSAPRICFRVDEAIRQSIKLRATQLGCEQELLLTEQVEEQLAKIVVQSTEPIIKIELKSVVGKLQSFLDSVDVHQASAETQFDRLETMFTAHKLLTADVFTPLVESALSHGDAAFEQLFEDLEPFLARLYAHGEYALLFTVYIRLKINCPPSPSLDRVLLLRLAALFYELDGGQTELDTTHLPFSTTPLTRLPKKYFWRETRHRFQLALQKADVFERSESTIAVFKHIFEDVASVLGRPLFPVNVLVLGDSLGMRLMTRKVCLSLAILSPDQLQGNIADVAGLQHWLDVIWWQLRILSRLGVVQLDPKFTLPVVETDLRSAQMLIESFKEDLNPEKSILIKAAPHLFPQPAAPAGPIHALGQLGATIGAFGGIAETLNGTLGRQQGRARARQTAAATDEFTHSNDDFVVISDVVAVTSPVDFVNPMLHRKARLYMSWFTSESVWHTDGGQSFSVFRQQLADFLANKDIALQLYRWLRYDINCFAVQRAVPPPARSNSFASSHQQPTRQQGSLKLPAKSARPSIFDLTSSSSAAAAAPPAAAPAPVTASTPSNSSSLSGLSPPSPTRLLSYVAGLVFVRAFAEGCVERHPLDALFQIGRAPLSNAPVSRTTIQKLRRTLQYLCYACDLASSSSGLTAEHEKLLLQIESCVNSMASADEPFRIKFDVPDIPENIHFTDVVVQTQE